MVLIRQESCLPELPLALVRFLSRLLNKRKGYDICTGYQKLFVVALEDDSALPDRWRSVKKLDRENYLEHDFHGQTFLLHCMVVITENECLKGTHGSQRNHLLRKNV